MNEKEYCKKVDDVLTRWLDVRMAPYVERQYGKGILRQLRDESPLKGVAEDEVVESSDFHSEH